MEIWQRNQNGLFPMNTKILQSTACLTPAHCSYGVLSTVGHYNSIFFFGSSKETTFMTISWDVAEKFIFKIYNIGNIFLYTLSNGIEFLEEISLSDIRWLKFQWNFTINFTRLWNFLPLSTKLFHIFFFLRMAPLPIPNILQYIGYSLLRLQINCLESYTPHFN